MMSCLRRRTQVGMFITWWPQERETICHLRDEHYCVEGTDNWKGMQAEWAAESSDEVGYSTSPRYEN